MDCAEAVLTRKRFPVKTVCRALKIARSNLLRRRQSGGKKRPGPAPKDDAGLLPPLKEIAERRPSYGYRRIQAVLNRTRKTEGLPPVNHKRVYRILKGNGLLLTRGMPRPERPHEGVVIALAPNLCWCSDVFEIPCDSGERVRVAFSLDACDREILSYVATTGGVGGDSIRDLMLQSVESRFGSIDRLPHPIEWLSDNGSCLPPMRRAILPVTWGSEFAEPRSRVRKATAWRNRLSKPLNAIMCLFIPVPMD